MASSDPHDSARAQLAAARDVLRRHQLPIAERLDRVLGGSDEEVQRFLISGELWGRIGSIVYEAGVAPSWQAQREVGDAFRALGEWQMAHSRANLDVTNWVGFFREQRGLRPLPGGESSAFRAVRVARPWGPRDVWLGVLAAAVIYGLAVGISYVAITASAKPNLEIWVAAVSLFELVFVVPVWLFAVRKPGGSWKALGFARFPLVVLGIGVGLLFAFYMFEVFYAALLHYFGLQVQTDITPIAERLSSPWPLIVGAVFVAPIAEETFFRGFVFAGLRARYDWRWAAVISAALFSAAHMELTFFIPGFLLGFLFAYLYERSNSLWPGVILHTAVNGLAMAVLYAQLY